MNNLFFIVTLIELYSRRDSHCLRGGCFDQIFATNVDLGYKSWPMRTLVIKRRTDNNHLFDANLGLQRILFILSQIFHISSFNSAIKFGMSQNILSNIRCESNCDRCRRKTMQYGCEKNRSRLAYWQFNGIPIIRRNWTNDWTCFVSVRWPNISLFSVWFGEMEEKADSTRAPLVNV